ncbi:hypothetical protein PDJ90_09910 [Bacillus cereus]|nr:hypothetical protein [Bacillus cereus]
MKTNPTYKAVLFTRKGQKKKVLLIIPLFIILLSGCSNNDIYGSWEVVDNKNGLCPISYKFETVVKEEKKEKIIQYLVEMQTTKKKEDLYKGSFVKNSNVYHIDYGNSFTSDQTLQIVDGKLNVYFYAVEKLCTYKKK